jgi:anti-anti-sigma factor
MNRQPRSAEEEGLMALQMRRVGKVTVIVLSGKLNTEAAQDLKRKLNDYCDRSPGHSLLDMSEVNYVSSYLIGVLVACHEKLKASGSELHLAGGSQAAYGARGRRARGGLSPPRDARGRGRALQLNEVSLSGTGSLPARLDILMPNH